MKRATCVGHSTMPRAQTCAFGVAFDGPQLANWAAANVTCARRTCKQWGLNPIKYLTPLLPTRRPRPQLSMDACSAPWRVSKNLTVTRAHQQRRHPRRAHILQPARTPAGSCNTNDQYGQNQKPELYLTSMLPTCAERPHPG